MRLACFDITGTLVHHHSGRSLALMPELLHSLKKEGWQLKIVTNWDTDTATQMLTRPGHPVSFPVESIDIRSGGDKAEIVRGLLTADVDELVFVDDKPKHIEAVQRIADPRVKVIGFFGSGKYAPDARLACLKAGASYVLTAVELAEQLNAELSHNFADLKHLTVDELIDLVAGLQCPGSSLAGETRSFDHRMVPAILFRRLDEWRRDEPARDRLWMNLAWIKCDECAFKLLVRLAVAEIGADSREVLGTAYKADEYIEAILKAPREIRRQLYERIRVGLGLMSEGIGRIHNATFGPDLAAFFESDEHNRLKKNRNRFRWAFAYGPTGPLPSVE